MSGTLYNLASGGRYVLARALPEDSRLALPVRFEVGQEFTARRVDVGGRQADGWWVLVTIPSATGQLPGLCISEGTPLFAALVARMSEAKPSLSSVAWGRGLAPGDVLRALDIAVTLGELSLAPLVNALDAVRARARPASVQPNAWDADGREVPE